MPSEQPFVRRLFINGEAFKFTTAVLFIEDEGPIKSWEVVARTSDEYRHLDLGDCAVRITTDDGRELAGRAIVTETDGENHRLLGNGPLEDKSGGAT